MSFDKQKDTVEEGDIVILYNGRHHIYPVEIDIKKTFQSRFGAYHHRDIIGKKYGAKIYSSKGWSHVLRPTPELWTVSLPHRTQILYTMDISMITFELELKPGSIVVEAGTGSGSLSHAIIRSTKPTGHLYTFDFHQNRVATAQEEFNKHYGPNKYVTCACADVCSDGFSLSDKADAVFLDLPTPWDAIPHAKTALKRSGGRICSFSPCIEQVQRTCATLRRERFCEIKTIECLVRLLKVQTVPFPEMVFDCNIAEEGKEAKKPRLDETGNDDNVECQMESIENKEKVGSTENNEKMESTENNEKMESTENNAKMESTENNAKMESMENSAKMESTENNAKMESTENSAKMESTENNAKMESIEGNVNDSIVDGGTNGAGMTGVNSIGMVTKVIAKSRKGNVNVATCQPSKEVTGHTGYLTFASLLPSLVDSLLL